MALDNTLTHPAAQQKTQQNVQRQQRTLKKSVTFSGIGVHTGMEVTVQFHPAPVGTGIVFRRVDLPGSPEIPATVEYARDIVRSTALGIGEIRLQTVEHALAALHANQIDNLTIDVNAEEMPIGNGSSDVFVAMIHDAGVEEQEHTTPTFSLSHPIHLSQGESHIVALPSDNYRISYTLSYPDSPVLRAQYHSTVITSEIFNKELAPCRTFSLYEEVSPLMDRGLIKGGSLNNAVVIKDNIVISKEGLFFPDEMVRHKVLDLVGDLALVGFNFCAHVIAVRTGHAINTAFAKLLYDTITQEGF